ncbi:hypothetical protein VT98_12075 [Candidatus Electrothrix communis]|uniref:Uncharacterized protein n=1 Tax=Candidatus Electrothrix communis TaxID=1859133 RepID=A0A3S3SQB8_9BACT|nr:hypothetical protein VT98_12075 [Candidatus Electrothrix communis]
MFEMWLDSERHHFLLLFRQRFLFDRAQLFLYCQVFFCADARVN